MPRNYSCGSEEHMKQFVTLLVTEAEPAAGGIVVQDMLYTNWLLALIELQVKLLMLLKIDSKGLVDFSNT